MAALNAYGLSPVDDSGASGYVYNGSNAMLNAVNLQAGDVITAINGQRLGDIEQDKSLLESWRGQAQVDIEKSSVTGPSSPSVMPYPSSGADRVH